MKYTKLVKAIDKAKDTELVLKHKDDNGYVYSIENNTVYRKFLENGVISKFKNMGTIEEFLKYAQDNLEDKWIVSE